jgi:hypothetical protein
MSLMLDSSATESFCGVESLYYTSDALSAYTRPVCEFDYQTLDTATFFLVSPGAGEYTEQSFSRKKATLIQRPRSRVGFSHQQSEHHNRR